MPLSPLRVKRRNTLSEQMFSAVPPTADIRRERRLRHAESPTLHLGDVSMVTVDEIGRVDPSVNDSSTPSARLQIALQKRPLIDCQSGYDFAGGNLNSKAVTTGDVFARDLAGIRTCRGNSRLVEFDVCKKTRRKSPTSGRMLMKVGISAERGYWWLLLGGRTR